MSSNRFAAFELPFSSTNREANGVHLLTGDIATETALTSDFTIQEHSRSPDAIEALHLVCSTLEELKTVQEFGAKGDGSKDGLTVGAGVQLTMEHSLTATTLLAVSTASIRTGVDTYDATTAKLTPTARERLEGDPASFIARYGTHFIGGRVLGATFYSLLKATCTEEKHKTNVKSYLSAKYEAIKKGKAVKGSPGGSGSANYGLDKSTAEKIRDFRGRIYARGVAVPLSFENLDTLAENFATFTQDAIKQSTEIIHLCYPYTMLSEVSDILESTGRTFMPSIQNDTVDAICIEARETMRAIAQIEEMADVARNIPECERINSMYRGKLQSAMQAYRNLSLDEIAAPPARIRLRVGLQSGHLGESYARQTSAEWWSEFEDAYNAIV